MSRESQTIIVIFVIAVAIVLTAVTVVLTRIRSEGLRELEQAFDAFEQMTGVRSLEQVRPLPVPDDRNAALVYQRAFDAFDAAMFTDEEIESLIDVDEIETVARLIERANAAVVLAIKAGKMDECDWQTTLYEDGYLAELPHLPYAQNIVRLLVAEARIASHAGDWQQARQVALAALRLREHLLADRVELLIHIGNAIEVSVIRVVRDNLTTWPIESLEEVVKEVKQVEWQPLYQQAIIVEALMALSVFEDPEEFGIEGLSGWFENRAWQMNRDKALFLQLMREEYELAVTPYHERDTSRKHTVPPSWAVVTRQTVPYLTSAHRILAHSDLNRTCLDVATRLEAIRRQSGRYPESWEMPDDPVTGRSIVYEVLEDGSGFRMTTDHPPRFDLAHWQVGDWPDADNGDEAVGK